MVESRTLGCYSFWFLSSARDRLSCLSFLFFFLKGNNLNVNLGTMNLNLPGLGSIFTLTRRASTVTRSSTLCVLCAN